MRQPDGLDHGVGGDRLAAERAAGVLVGVVEPQVVGVDEHRGDDVGRGRVGVQHLADELEARAVSVRPATAPSVQLDGGVGDRRRRRDMISGSAAPMTVFHTGCHWSAGRVSATAASGTNTSSSTTVCEPVARSPSVSQVSSMLTPSAVSGHGAVEHLRAVGRVVPADAGHEHVADLAAAGRALAGADPVAAVDPPGGAVRADPVRRAGADEHRAVVDDLARRRPRRPCRGGGATPGRRRDGSASTRRRRSPGRAAAELAQDRAHLGVRRRRRRRTRAARARS